MSAWKDLPRPATPGPWATVGSHDQGGIGIEYHASGRLNDPDARAVTYSGGSYMPPLTQDAAAIAALPEIRDEVDRLRAWVDDLVRRPGEPLHPAYGRIRAGEWPEGRRG